MHLTSLFLHVLRLLSVAASCMLSTAAAQESKATAPAASTQLSIPSILNANNVSRFRSLLPKDFGKLIAQHGIELHIERSLSFPWKYDEAWEEAVTQADQNLLGANGRLRALVDLKRGPLFGNSRHLDDLSDDKERGAKILWNVMAVWWSQQLSQHNFRLVWPGSAAKVNQYVQGSAIRVYPTLLGEANRGNQLFREIISLTLPRPLTPYQTLSFRFFGEEEDLFWVASPAIQKVRQLTGSNRADSLLRSGFSPDDFLTWSGKPELVAATSSASKTVLLPFADNVLLKALVGEDKCITVQSPPDDARAVSAVIGPTRVPESGLWIPPQITLIPRSAWEVELISQDPYSLYGRQVLYVDTESFLPLVKLVYNRSGSLWKVVLSAFDAAEVPAQNRHVPHYVGSVVFDAPRNKTYLLEVAQSMYCPAWTPAIQLAGFDPSKLMPEAPKAKETPDVKGKGAKGKKEAPKAEPDELDVED